MDLPKSNAPSSEPQISINECHRAELLAVAAFVLVNLLAPVLCGELYPFTVSPMFSDQPSAYCTYEIFGPDGKEMDLEPFGMHLVYDGNPPGLGMGITPTPTLHSFGEICAEQTVVDQVRRIMTEADIAGPLTVKRTHVEGGEPQLETTIDEWIVAEVENP